MRFVVTEIEGYLEPSVGKTTTAHPGLSCQIIDTFVNRCLIATYRTEDQTLYPGRTNRDGRAARIRQLAAEHAARLNAQHAEKAA